MVVSEAPSLEETLAQLDRVAPGVPLLALGQTVFWDEPMKALVARAAAERGGGGRRFVAGVHDTDFFAKLPAGPRRPGAFVTVGHNDTTTRGLWSAAAEFSTLFGSETVVTRERLLKAGLALDRLREGDPHILDRATEAWGWRGIVSLDESPPLTSEVPALALLPELLRVLAWAFEGALAAAPSEEGRRAAAEIEARVAEACASGTLADAYERLAPWMYALVDPDAGIGGASVETDRTSRLLRFNRETCGRPRFSLARLFVESSTRPAARRAYDEAVTAPGPNAGQYELARFGTGAIPFDLVIPGHGRGVVRLGARGAVVGTRTPLFLSFKRPVESLEEFAAAVEAKFGPDCALIGKAVTLLGMLAAEHVFVFHEGASGYAWRSAHLHRLLCERLAWCQALHPILRVGYDTWGGLAAVERDLALPEELRRPFAAHLAPSPPADPGRLPREQPDPAPRPAPLSNTLPARDFAAALPTVAAEAEALLATLARTRRPADLLALLAEREPGAWRAPRDRYAALARDLDAFVARTEAGRAERKALYDRRRALRRARAEAEHARGVQFRTEIFEAHPGPAALARRRERGSALGLVLRETAETEAALKTLLRRQGEEARDPRVRAAVAERRAIETEAERERLALVRESVLAGEGLAHAALRPSAWWLVLVSPDRAWTRAVAATATARLEPLRP